MTPGEELREVAELLESALAGLVEQPPQSWPWSWRLSPLFAPSLAAWMRAEADCADAVTSFRHEVPPLMGQFEASITGEDPSTKWELSIRTSSLGEALACARLIRRDADRQVTT